MSDKRAIALVVVVAFAGIFGASQAGIFALTDENPTTTTMRYLGHVTAVVYDSNGNIKSYFQTDNIIVDHGRSCTADLVFGTNFRGFDCTIVDRMAIGSSINNAVGARNSTLGDETDNGKKGPIALTDLIAATDDAPLDDVMFTLSNTFIILEADKDKSISEAGLFDDKDNMFARSLIGPFPVTTDDKITVNWDFIID